MRFDEKLAKLKAILSEESTFPDAAEDVVEQLNALAGGRLTDEMLAYFRMLGMSRNERVFLGNIQFLGAEWMIKENTDAVPACTVRPFGFFCVASYINGDAICVDLEDVLSFLGRPDFRLRRFLLNLQVAFLAGDIERADEILVSREIELKTKARAKLCHAEDFHPNNWVGGRYLDYRFGDAKRIVTDIYEGEGAAHVSD